MKITNRKKQKDRSSADFEIEFYENILKKRPNFIQALIALGDAYTRGGLYEKGLKIDEELSRLKPDDPIVFYNLSCSYSLLSKIDLSFKALKKSIELGYDDFDYMQKDADLDNLRRDRRFKKLILKRRFFDK